MKKQIIVLLLLFAAAVNAQDAKEIIKKMDDKLQGDSNKSEMKMSIVRPKYTRTIAFKNWSLGRDYFLTYVTAPSKDKGMVSMKYKKEMWSYTPSINRMIKLPPSMMSQGWMGSDYTNDDLVKQSSIVEDYTHTLIGEETVDGRPCFKIQMVPNPDANVVWGKILAWVHKEKYINLKAEYYDEEEFLVRTELGKEVKTFDGRELPSIIEIIPAEEPDNRTIISIDSIEFDVDIKESFFSQQNMKRVR
ncbi:outer membrane lipoprotein-sorting protein [Prolixibacteraceae bacterium Z1-6]|uniref:Outer membrane lipoprotein-sorting protein n=1 Tax=Draconibacterium aestuarii TaxID=2998507 RepID=A0A9X3J6C6_9BACT|nr:outer membrane lipoprotein-sorting protein [Prolixibacteraceae bacterium Z1-6]